MTRFTPPCTISVARGFTLVEVLVALAVVAIALVAGLQSSASLTRLSERQGDQLLAQLCADNELAKVRLLRQMPGVGTTTGTCAQAQRLLQTQVDVVPTPNPNFRRVDVRVNTPAGEGPAPTTLLQLSTVVGRF
jgi:general secretion pathway protein I